MFVIPSQKHAPGLTHSYILCYPISNESARKKKYVILIQRAGFTSEKRKELIYLLRKGSGKLDFLILEDIKWIYITYFNILFK